MIRLVVALLLLALVVAAGWSFAWYSLAAFVGANLDSVVVDADDLRLRCGERRIEGFPFAFRLHCGEASAASATGEVSGTLTALDFGTDLAEPGRVAASFVAPVTVTTPFVPEPIDLRWNRAAAALDLSPFALPRPSFSGDGLSATLGQLGITAARLALRAVPSDDGRSVTFAASAGQVAVASPGSTTAATDFSVSATLLQPGDGTLEGAVDAVRRDGLAIPDLRLDIRAEESRVALKGALVIDREGFLNGAADLSVTGLERLPALLSRWPEGVRAAVGPWIGSVLTLAEPGELDGVPARVLKIRFSGGEMRIGPSRFEIGPLIDAAPADEAS